MKISLSADHAGYKYKEIIKKHLQDKGIEVIDHGAYSDAPADYPDFVKPAAYDVVEKRADKAIGVCGSGQGTAITANKVKGIRAALVLNEKMAELAVQHNNSNFLALGQRFIDEKDLLNIVDAWLNAKFEGGRHEIRVKKIE